MGFVQTLLQSTLGKMIATAAVSMVPVLELRGGIPFGTALGLSPVRALAAAIVGNLIPSPLIIIFIRRIFLWIRKRFPKLGGLVDRLEKKAHLKGETVTKYSVLGLYILVALPLPGTGAWTGSLVAAILDIRLRRALPSIVLGVITAGLIMTFVTQAVVSLT